MTLDEIDLFCTNLPGASCRYPFESNPTLRAWCLGKRMFAWTVTDRMPLVIQLKANPELVPTLIANYDPIQPGYHMNKRHWVSVSPEGCDSAVLRGLLEDAHQLIAESISKAERMRLLGD